MSIPVLNARVWNKKKKKMMSVFSIVTFYNNIVTSENSDPDDEFELMLNFGTTDKNGTPIFTGDIIKIRFIVSSSYIDSDEFVLSGDGNFYAIAKVIFEENAVRYEIIDDDESEDESRLNGDELSGYMFCECILTDEVAEASEVVGNIFEKNKMKNRKGHDHV